jgi:hypothetical protein
MIARRVALGCTVALLYAVPCVAQDTTRAGPSRAQSRPATCAAGLHEYRRLEDVPAPFDTIQPSVPPTPVKPENFRTFLLDIAAAGGATGFVSRESTGPGDSFAIGMIFVFVPSDSARIRAACERAKKAPG